MSENLLAGRIAQLRKEAGMTQEQLGNALGLTYQSVSKWENGLSCPDVQLLPQLADLFHVTLDDLFGREAPQPQRTAEQEEAERTLPWPDDDTLYAVMYHGHQLLTEDPAVLKGHREELRFVYDGPAVNVSSWFDVVCESGPVEGSVTANGSVTCGDVGGNVTAGGSLSCGDVGGSAVSRDGSGKGQKKRRSISFSFDGKKFDTRQFERTMNELGQRMGQLGREFGEHVEKTFNAAGPGEDADLVDLDEKKE